MDARKAGAAAGDETAGGLHDLQAFLFGFEDMPDALYVRSPSGRRPHRDADSGAFQASAGDVLSFESYFNSFYLAYWRAHCALDRLGLSLSFTGQLRLRIVGTGPGGREVLCESVLVGDGRATTIWLPDSVLGDTGPGRLHLVVQFTADTHFAGAAFVTDTAPRRTPRLSLGLCTFNNEARLAATMRRLVEARALLPEIDLIAVVNQGDRLGDPALLADLATLGVTPVPQRNLGGAGGFARTMALATDPGTDATHHLLMDDDIQIDPAMIRRALDFLAHAGSDDLAFGGSMFSHDRPHELTEAGARIGIFWQILANGIGLDMRQRDALRHFDQRHVADYNAWWFCIVPTDAIRRLGLPYPMFLHGDDIEYGLRLEQDGIETVSLPGVAVWHDDIVGKARDWIVYYDFRNILINAALFPAKSPPFDALILLGVLFAPLLSHRYGHAAALNAAVRDYLAGPQHTLGDDSQTQYEQLRETLARLPEPETVEVTPDTTPPRGPAVAPPEPLWVVVRLFVRRFFEIALPRRRRPLLAFTQPEIHPCNTGPGAYARVVPQDPGQITIYRPNRIRLWRGMVENFWTTLRFLRQAGAAAEAWRLQAPAFSQPDHWDKVFAASDAERADGD